jgi:predicted ATPase
VGYHYSYISYLEKNMRAPDEASLLGRFVPALGLEDEPELVARLLELATGKPKKTVFPIPARVVEPAISAGNAWQLPPSLTSMLGREREVALLNEMLQNAEVRLVTIVGPPGVGKTRLALHIAEQAGTNFSDGVVFVNLTPVIQAELILPAIANALGIQELAKISIREELKTVLHKKNLLIVMDNFEQVVDTAPQLIPLLGDAPGVKILATSREALRVRGEQEFPLAPLSVSDDSFLDSPAVRLFIERAHAVKPDFQLDEKTASYAAEICRRLDGLPLAIELAAARVQTLSLSAMLGQFDRRFEWLTRGGRDLPVWRQTLWGAIEWSYNLLTGQERALLNRLSVFAGGWTIEAAEAICSDDTLCAPSDIFNLLMQLVDKSLVVADGERYHFLETLREFAHEKLKESNELERMHQLHCEHYLKFSQTARPHVLQGGDQARWLDRMEVEHNNLRAALAWSIAAPNLASAAMELGWAMREFWYTRGHFTEARRWLDKILTLDSAPTVMRANLLRNISDFASAQGDYKKAREYEEEGMEISKALGDEAGVYYSMDGLAMLAGMQGDYAHAAELLEQVLVYRRQINDTARLTATLNNLAIASRRLGNIERAKQLYTEAIAVSKSVGNIKSLAHTLIGLAEVHTELKEYATAVRLQHESISIRHQLGDLKGLAFSFESLAMSLDHLGDSLLATQLESASNKIFRELGVVVPLASRAEIEGFLVQLRARLGETAFEDAWANGQAMSLKQAVTLALDEH